MHVTIVHIMISVVLVLDNTEDGRRSNGASPTENHYRTGLHLWTAPPYTLSWEEVTQSVAILVT